MRFRIMSLAFDLGWHGMNGASVRSLGFIHVIRYPCMLQRIALCFATYPNRCYDGDFVSFGKCRCVVVMRLRGERS